MKKAFIGMAAVAAALATALLSVPTVALANGTDMYRLYNPNSGEHFYTASAGERSNLKAAGWRSEGTGWVAPTSGEAVYRVYNPNGGDHHYTTSAGERNALVKLGWRDEGVGWRSGGSVAVYRLYNPKAATGAHHYTTSAGERDLLVKAGWKSEGVGWYAMAVGKSEPAEKVYKVRFDLIALWGNSYSAPWTKDFRGTSPYGSATVATQLADLRSLNPGLVIEQLPDMGSSFALATLPGTNVKLYYSEYSPNDASAGILTSFYGPLGEIVDGIGSDSVTVAELASRLQSYNGAYDNTGTLQGSTQKFGLCCADVYVNSASIYFADGDRAYPIAQYGRLLHIDSLSADGTVNAGTIVSVYPNGSD